MRSILSFLNGCEFGKKQTCRNLTLFPVLHSNGVEPYYLRDDQGRDIFLYAKLTDCLLTCKII